MTVSEDKAALKELIDVAREVSLATRRRSNRLDMQTLRYREDPDV